MAEEKTMTNKVATFVDTLQKGDNAAAGDMFKDALRDKVANALDTRRVEVAKSIFNGVEAQPHSDPKPAVTDPNPETDVLIDTQGQEIQFEPNGNEQPTPEAEVPSAESQPVNQ